MIRNIAVLAHVDAGKTTLSERILFTAGEVLHPGNVEDGLATLDYLPEEKAKGITIEAGVETFHWKETQFNLLDTPGHIDFGIEVDMALAAVDTVILVISSISGVESQTRSAWNKLKKQGIRTILFINKVDHPSNRLEEVLLEIEEGLVIKPVLLNHINNDLTGSFDIISPILVLKDKSGKETKVDRLSSFEIKSQIIRKEACEAVATCDDQILEKCLNGEDVSPKELIEGLDKLFKSNEYVACYCGSAIQCLGVRQLMTGVTLFNQTSAKQKNKNCIATVLRVRHTREGVEYALCKTHQDLPKKNWPHSSSFFRIHGEILDPLQSIHNDDIVALIYTGQNLELGMQIGYDGSIIGYSSDIQEQLNNKSLPLLHTRIECISADDFMTIKSALMLAVRNDPSIRLEEDIDTGGWILKTVGEVQLEVVLSRLQRETACNINISQPDVILYEHLLDEELQFKNEFKPSNDSNSYLIELTISRKQNIDENTIDFKTQINENLKEIINECCMEFLSQGITGKGSLVGVSIEIKHWSAPEQPLIGYVRKVIFDALKLSFTEAKIEVFEPYMEITVECPQDFASNLLADLKGRGAKIHEIGGNGIIAKMIAELPLKKVFGYSTIGRSISKGTASYALRYTGHRSIQA